MIRILTFCTLIFSILIGKDITAYEVMERVYSLKKPKTSIMEIKLELVRKKGKREKKKVREFIRYEKYYDSGPYRSKSVSRFTEPKMINGTGLLSWVERDGNTQQWFFLPKLKKPKKISTKEKSKSFLNTDFIYEDLESRSLGMDSLVSIGTEFLDNLQCHVIIAWPNNTSNYFFRKIWINNQNWQICKVEYYTNETTKEKTLFLSKFIEKDGFTTPGKFIMEVVNGNKTIMEIISFQPDIGLKEEIFSKSFLVKN